MSAKKNVLIVTDGTESIELIAQSIKEELADSNVKISPVNEFKGTDLLPSQAFFLGCSEPNPASFAYLEEMLAHINLAGRKCGFFSDSKEALKYLSSIVKDCEASCGEPLLINDGKKPDIKEWIKGIG